MKITIGIATNRGVNPKTVQCLLDLMAYEKHEFNPVVMSGGMTVNENRNLIALQAFNNQSDYVLYIDDDMTFPKDTLSRLLKHQKDVVGVYSYIRKLPKFPTVSFLDENGVPLPKSKMPFITKPKQLFECFGVGMGVALVDAKLFKEIPPPWFMFEWDDKGNVKVGEDIYFCKRVRDIGKKIWCDPRIKVGHIGTKIY